MIRVLPNSIITKPRNTIEARSYNKSLYDLLFVKLTLGAPGTT
jgi:hypothetical protein